MLIILATYIHDGLLSVSGLLVPAFEDAVSFLEEFTRLDLSGKEKRYQRNHINKNNLFIVKVQFKQKI